MPPVDSVRATAERRLDSPLPVPPGKPGPVRNALALARNIWRQLTSMRTALILLFLLALGSLPGALLPQWNLNSGKTAQYILDHPTIGPWLNRLGFLNVFSSPWYSAIYILLFVSLIGCLLPRSFEFAGQLRAKPVAAPRNLARLPHHDRVTVSGTPDEVAERVRKALRRKGIGGWRVAVRADGDTMTVSAERGYLREIGNLVFHFALLGLLLSVAIGSLFGYAASVIVTVPGQFCSAGPVSYDNYRPGRLVDGTDMTPFCLNVEKFIPDYTSTGQAVAFRTTLQEQSGAQLNSDTWTNTYVEVNDPLHIAGQRLYLLGHGYTPTFTVTFPDGQTRDYSAPFQPTDSEFTSQGVVKIPDPPGYTGGSELEHQIGIVGVFAPTGEESDGVLSSSYPAMDFPEISIEVYVGDLGLNAGQTQSVFELDNSMVAQGLLKQVTTATLSLVDPSVTLSDGTKITFTGAQDWVSLQTSYDPAQGWALVSAICLVAGLLTSLTIKRRRVWYRIGTVAPSDAAQPARSVVDVGGLARTDQAGYGAEFTSLVALAGTSDTAVER